MMKNLLQEGKSLFLLLTFDFDAESAEVHKKAEFVELSYGKFGAKKGVYNVLKVLNEYDVKATFFVPGWVAENYPEAVSSIIKSGHEVGAHGYLHEKLDLEKDKYSILNKMDSLLSNYMPKDYKGFRAPYWRMSKDVLEYIKDLGYRYDSSLMDDDEPYVLEVSEEKIVELPIDWRLDDWPILKERMLDPKDFSTRIIEEIRYAVDTTKYLCVTMHPQLIGRGRNIHALEEIIKFGIAVNAEFITCSQLVQRILSSY